jgi:hypothetical protein
MKARMGFSWTLILFGLLILTSCLKAPKRIDIKSDDAAASSPTEVETAPDSDANKNTQAVAGLAALHAEQKSCVQCHEKNRPAPMHYGKEDCATCHSFPNFTERKLFTHMPKPQTCETCHARPATAGLRAYPNQGPPVGFDPNNKAAPGSGHYVGKDCASCHATPAEGAMTFTFSHSTPKADFCLPCHFNDGRGEHANDPAIILRDFGNCFSCHKNFDRNATRNFDTAGG